MRLANHGPADVTVTVAVAGPARPFAWAPPDPVPVPAGGEATVRLRFRVPRASQPPAGRLPYEVAVMPAGAGEPATRVGGAIDVRPFGVLSVALSEGTETDDGHARYDLTLGNRGNSPMPAALHAQPDGDVDLAVAVDPPSVVVTPGSRATATVDVAATRRPRSGDPVEATFTVVARPEVGDAVEVQGRYTLRPRFRRVPVMPIAIAASVALVAAAVVFAVGGSAEGPASPAGDNLAGGGSALDACPAQGHVDEFGVRGLERHEIARLPDTYTFLRVKGDNCSPMRFNPCEPVHFVQNAEAAPPFAAENVREAFRRLTRATGIEFVDDGLTDERTRTGPVVPDRYGRQWAPILIVWEHFPPEQTSGASQILGNTVVYREEDVVVSGRLRFNVDAYNDEFTKRPIEAGFGPPVGSGDGPIGRHNIQWGRIVLHELAHIVGLGHNRDPGSLMYPDAAQHTSRPADFMPTDLAGLRYLGREAGCVATPPLPTG